MVSADVASRVLVTGANGYIGRILCQYLRDEGYIVRAAVRSAEKAVLSAQETAIVGTLDAMTDWQAALSDVDYVIHLAARAHVDDKHDEVALRAFRETNVDGTGRLIEQSQEQGIKRLVFVSSIGVHGDQSTHGPFREDTPIQPVRPYQIAKWEAEQLFSSSDVTLDYVIVRPPLVYGPNAPGNLSRLIRLIQRGIPLPLAGIHNTRSLIGVRNLVHFLVHCLHHDAASRETFVICDGEDLTASALVRSLASNLQLRVVLFRVPEWAIRLVARVLGRERIIDQLWGSLQVDARKARTQLGWIPPFTVHEEITWLANQDQAKSSI